MLTISGSKFDLCDGFSRRSFLKIGGLALGGVALPQLLQAEQDAGLGSSHKSVIMIFLSGGPPHQDMFDLKPEAQRRIPRRILPDRHERARHSRSANTCRSWRSDDGPIGRHSHDGRLRRAARGVSMPAQRPPRAESSRRAVGLVSVRRLETLRPRQPAHSIPRLPCSRRSCGGPGAIPVSPASPGMAHAPFKPNASGTEQT